ncbi:MAG: PKD domain-containing protein [Bacteroidia bacterium]|nr:PKD domain-containing protein [Bacteroidia bacterium]
MKNCLLLLLTGLLFSLQSPLLLAQSTKNQKTINKVFKDRGEVYFKFKIQDKSELSVLTKFISIDNLKGKTVYAYANRKGFLKFLETGHYKYKILPKPSELEPIQMLQQGGAKSLTLNAYPTYPQYVSMMQNFASSYPDLCQLYSIGTTVNGRSLLVLKISDHVQTREYEPQFLYTSTMHGDETTGYILMLKYIDHLLSNYGTNPRVTNMVNSMEIWINPLANPDGTYAGGDNTVNGATRFNANNVDLNRNYPDFMDGAHPDGEAYQPETMSFMGFADTMDFVMAANFHGGAELFNYPWDTKAEDHPDRNWWSYVGGNYVDTLYANSTNYFIDFQTGFDSPGLTDGFAWYEANGGRQDYMNFYRHCREVTIEMSSTKTIPANQFETYWGYNLNALMYYMESTFKGFYGLVSDACTGAPVKAKVFVNNHDADSSYVYSSLPIGNYYRPIYPGTYSVTYSAPGYQSQTISNLSIGFNQSVEQNISLQPIVPTTDFVASPTSGCGGIIEFTDLSGSASSWLWNFGDGQTSTEQNPTHSFTSSGTYSVQLTTTNCVGSDSETKTNYLNIQVASPPSLGTMVTNACSPQSFTLQASGTGTIVWYDSPTAFNSIAEGNSFTTPILSSNAVYYVANQEIGYSGSVGSTNNNANGGYFTGNTYHYLVFDALSDFTLESVVINANSSGNRTIDLRSSAGVVLQSITVNVPQGISTVNLGFNIPTGTGYQLGTAGGSNFFRNNAGSSYPYTDNTTVSITGNSANQPSYYYYFYNWQVKQSCNSERVAIPLYIGTGNPPQLAVTPSVSTICTNAPVTFTAAASNVSNPSYSWSINGVASSETSNTLVVLAPVNGQISCTVSDPTNCSGTTTATANFNVNVVFPPNAPTITLNGNTLQANPGTNVQWYVNGQAIPGATGATYDPVVSGDYIAVIEGPACSSAFSNSITVTITGLPDAAQLSQVQLFPNPSKDWLFVNHLPVGTYDLQVFDVLGQCILNQTNLSAAECKMDVKPLEKGWYILKISNEKASIQKPFVVEK